MGHMLQHWKISYNNELNLNLKISYNNELNLVLFIYFKSFVTLHHILTTEFEESLNNMQPQLASFSCRLIPDKQS